MPDIKPVTHLEKTIAGSVDAVTHLEKVIKEYGGGGGGGGSVDVDETLDGTSSNPVENKAIVEGLNGKADAVHNHDDRYYTTQEADAAIEADIEAAFAGITTFEYYLCGNGEYDPSTGEPTVSNPDNSHIYLTPTSGDNLYMYAYIDNAFVFLGTTEMDLSDYYDKTAVDGLLADKQDAATAFSGDYNDLTNKPTIPVVPTNISAFTNDANYVASSALATVATSGAYSDLSGTPNLATVATSGAYSDLSGKPSLATVATSGAYSDLSGKPSLATVATSGSYNDLNNKPSIPTVPSNVLLGKVNGTNTQLTIDVIDSGTPASGTPNTTITIVRG